METVNKIFLIDFENVRSGGLKELNEQQGDLIVLFFTVHADKVDLDALTQLHAPIQAIKVAEGKQSLDMHLISYLGYLIGTYGDRREYAIVSNDGDYDHALEFWTSRGFSAYRIKSHPPVRDQDNLVTEQVTTAPSEQKAEQEGEKEKTPGKPKKVQPKPQVFSGKERVEINARILRKCHSLGASASGIVGSTVAQRLGDPSGKIKIYRDLLTKLGKADGQKAYQTIKPELDRIWRVKGYEVQNDLKRPL